MTAISPRRVEPGFADYSAEALSPLTAVRATLTAFMEESGSLDKIREAVVDALYENLENADPILAMLQAARDAGRLSQARYAELAHHISRLTTEELSTDVVPGSARLSSDSATVRPKEHRPVDAGGHRADFTAAAGIATAASKPLAAGSVLLERFELLGCVADQGMSRVFQARDRIKTAAGHPDALIAIKLLQQVSGDPLHGLQQEVLIAQTLNHPNIVNVFDLCRDADQYFITMEWLDGESLATRLDANRGRPLPAAQARSILEGLATAMAFAHGKGIAHRDIKPGNVHLTADGEVKLLDFGIARRIGSAPSADADGERVVTRAYASCELLEGELPDVRDDIYSLCCLWYRLITGVRPFGNRDALEAERDQTRAKRPPGLSRSQWQTLQCGLAFRRAQRPDDVAALARELLPGPARGAPAKQFAVALMFAGLAGTAIWGYWPEMNSWFDSQTGLALESSAPITAPPRTSERAQELVNLGPTQAPPAASPIEPAAPISQPSIAPAPIETDQPAPSPDTQETKTLLTSPDNELELLPPAQPVANTMSSVIASPADDAAAVEPRFAPLGFRQDQYIVSENDIAVILDVDYPRTLAKPISLSVIIERGTAVAEKDFIVPSNEVIMAGPGEPAARIIVPLISDSMAEYTEEFLVRLTTDDPAVQITRPEAVIIIRDDD
jgi:serine/threonine protein kinase